MKSPEAYPSGYTKTQVVLTTALLSFGFLFLVDQSRAAELFTTNAVAPSLIGRETIHLPERSIVMLAGEQREQAEQKWTEKMKKVEPIAVDYMMASAYNSLPEQTDGSPYLTAIGSLTRDGVIATNYYPIGTKIRIPDYYGEKVFRVEDRMNPRYSKTLDIWMESKTDAKEWGRRYIKVEIVQYGKGRGVE